VKAFFRLTCVQSEEGALAYINGLEVFGPIGSAINGNKFHNSTRLVLPHRTQTENLLMAG